MRKILIAVSVFILSIVASAQTPTTAKGWHELGMDKLFGEVRDPAGAVTAFGECLKLDPKNSECLKNRGNAHQDLKAFEKAIADYDSAIKLAPANTDIYNAKLSLIDRDLNQPDLVIREATKAIAALPETQSFYAYRGRAYLRTGKLAEAIADATKLIELDKVQTAKSTFAGAKMSGAGYVIRSKAYCLQKKGDLAEADEKAAATTFAKIDIPCRAKLGIGGPEDLALKAKAEPDMKAAIEAMQEGKYATAIVSLSRVLKVHPVSLDARYQMAKIQFDHFNDMSWASKHVSDLLEISADHKEARALQTAINARLKAPAATARADAKSLAGLWKGQALMGDISTYWASDQEVAIRIGSDGKLSVSGKDGKELKGVTFSDSGTLEFRVPVYGNVSSVFKSAIAADRKALSGYTSSFTENADPNLAMVNSVSRNVVTGTFYFKRVGDAPPLPTPKPVAAFNFQPGYLAGYWAGSLMIGTKQTPIELDIRINGATAEATMTSGGTLPMPVSGITIAPDGKVSIPIRSGTALTLDLTGKATAPGVVLPGYMEGDFTGAINKVNYTGKWSLAKTVKPATANTGSPSPTTPAPTPTPSPAPAMKAADIVGTYTGSMMANGNTAKLTVKFEMTGNKLTAVVGMEGRNPMTFNDVQIDPKGSVRMSIVAGPNSMVMTGNFTPTRRKVAGTFVFTISGQKAEGMWDGLR